MRLSGTKATAIHQYRGLGNQLWDLAGNRPSLDLRFADDKSLVDATTGTNLIDFTRASSGTYVGSDGLIKTATTNEARFDHDPTTGESLGLLVEEQRTNLLLRSEEFDDANWSKSSVTVTANSLTAPNGTGSADTLTDTSDGSAAAHAVLSPNQSFTSGLEYTVSVYAKAGTLPGVAFIFESAAFGSNLDARFNVTTGTVESLSAGLTGSIAAVGDGWYRCSATATATATASTTIQIRTATASTSFYQGDGTGTIYVWGAQLEEGSFPTSYIPTTISAVTRAADVASITGTNFSSWYRQDEGTVFYDTTIISAPDDLKTEIVSVSDGTEDNYLGVFIPSQLNHRAVVKLSGANEYLANTIPTGDVFEPAKVALAYQENNTISAGNGSLAPLDTSCTLPTVDQFHLGQPAGGAELSQRIRRLVFWPARLPDSTLEGITHQ